MLALYLLLLISTAFVNAHPDGAPLTACDTMTPVHQANLPQPSASPYTITLSNSAVSVGVPITVTVSAAGGETFQGVLVKALPMGVDTGVAGVFINSLPNVHYLDCNNVTQSAVTHSDPSNKTSITVQWRATAPGQYNFKATVAMFFETFWVGLISELVTVS